jgi:dynein heavy chain 2
MFLTSVVARFYFIGDDDLLEILGQAQNPAVIRSHLKKLFQGINDVAFSPDTRSIIAMRSIDEEEVLLAHPVAITDVIESWLAALAAEMQVRWEGWLVSDSSNTC